MFDNIRSTCSATKRSNLGYADVKPDVACMNSTACPSSFSLCEYYNLLDKIFQNISLGHFRLGCASVGIKRSSFLVEHIFEECKMGRTTSLDKKLC